MAQLDTCSMVVAGQSIKVQKSRKSGHTDGMANAVNRRPQEKERKSRRVRTKDGKPKT